MVFSKLLCSVVLYFGEFFGKFFLVCDLLLSCSLIVPLTFFPLMCDSPLPIRGRRSVGPESGAPPPPTGCTSGWRSPTDLRPRLSESDGHLLSPKIIDPLIIWVVSGSHVWETQKETCQPFGRRPDPHRPACSSIIDSKCTHIFRAERTPPYSRLWSMFDLNEHLTRETTTF